MIIYEAKINYSAKGEIQSDTLHNTRGVLRYLKSAVEENPMQEVFYVIALNRKNKPLGFIRATMGTVSETLVAPREVFRYAILQSASAILVAHNHPSGDPSPSRADIQITRTLREASKIIGIEFLDHIIIGDPNEDDPLKIGYYSFRDMGFL